MATRATTRKNVLVVLAVLSLGLVPTTAHAGRRRVDPKHLEDEHELSMQVVTPHTPWAKPYAGGQVRALFFAARRNGFTKARHIVELMQRFDLAADAAYYQIRPKTWLGGELGHRRIGRLLGKPRDVYVFLGVSPTALPDGLRESVLNKVAQGAGIVLVGADAKRILNPANQLKKRPAWLSVGDGYKVDKGHGVRLPARKELAYRVGWQVEYDHQAEQTGRAILWAAGREPRMTLTVSATPGEIPRAALPAKAVAAAWTDAPTGTAVQVVLRRWDGHKTTMGRADCQPAKGTATFKVPVLRAGTYHVEAFATSSRGTECWATTSFAVTSTRTVKAVQLAKAWSEVGGHVAGTVDLAGAPLANERLTVRLMDRRGRILVRNDLPTSGNQVPFRFRVEAWMPMLLRVQAVITHGDKDVATAYAYAKVTKRHRGQFNFIVWGCPGDTLGPYAAAGLARMGTTAVLGSRRPSPALSAYEIASVPYATWIGGDFFTLAGALDRKGVMKGGCWNDDARIQKRVQAVVDKCRPAREHGALAYSLGDECAVRGSCLGPHCLKAYQRYLEKVYGDIGALNAEWGTRFKTFDEVTLSEAGKLPAADAPPWFKTYYKGRLDAYQAIEKKKKGRRRAMPPSAIPLGDKNDEIPSLQAGNYARWYDRQAFQCYNLVQYGKRYARAFRRIDPKALTGFEGTNSFMIPRHPMRIRQGGDVDLIVRELGWWGPYPGSASEIVRSIVRPGVPWGNWMGYVKHARGLLSKYWMMITRGETQVQWWRVDGVGQFHGLLAPHLGPYPATRELLEDTQIVRHGLGTLLTQSTMLDDGIAMLYSMPSTYISHFDGNRSYGHYHHVHRAWFQAIRDLGLQFRYVTDRMLRRGEFNAQHYKVLVLPFALAVGPKEADVIRAFVEAGGTVIADVRTGVYDGHCKPLAKGVLDDVFGVRRDGRAAARTVEVGAAGSLAGRKVACPAAKRSVDPTVRLTTGRAMGKAQGVPVCIVNELGKGRAVLLNFALPRGSARTLVQPLVAAAGIQTQITLKKPDGQPVDRVEVIRWRTGRVEITALYGSHNGKVQVALPADRFVYDLRLRRPLGRTKRLVTELIAGRATFFALLPHAAPGVRVALDTPSASRGTVVKATVSIPGAAGNHAVRIRASTPDSRAADWLDQVVIVAADPIELSLPIAHNDPVGTWTIKAIDLYTGKPVAVPLNVR